MTDTSTVGEGAETITYDVHGSLGSGVPIYLFGSPMDAVGFGSLVDRLRTRAPERPVVVSDPRGSGRNPTDTSEISVEQHAEDLHRVISALGVGPVDCFGSSGGAVNLLRLCELHPDDVRRAVAHEPPTAALLPDRDLVMAALHDVKQTYQAAGDGPGMAKFIALVMVDGELPADHLTGPDPDPAMFGLPVDDDGTRTSPLMRNMPACNEYDPDVAALAAYGERLVVAVGADSSHELAARGAASVAAAVGLATTEFPGGHNGFSGGEYGQPAADPDGFATRLLAVLGGAVPGWR